MHSYFLYPDTEFHFIYLYLTLSSATRNSSEQKYFPIQPLHHTDVCVHLFLPYQHAILPPLSSDGKMTLPHILLL